MEKRRGEACASRAQAAVAGIRYESSFSVRIPDTAVTGRLQTAGTSPHEENWFEPIWVYLCDLWALFVVGLLEADGESGCAIQLAKLSAFICVICGFSWAGGPRISHLGSGRLGGALFRPSGLECRLPREGPEDS